jgi:hypothetical protein
LVLKSILKKVNPQESHLQGDNLIRNNLINSLKETLKNLLQDKLVTELNKSHKEEEEDMVVFEALN